MRREIYGQGSERKARLLDQMELELEELELEELEASAAEDAGFNRLYLPDRRPGPITEAACWSHGRRKFFVLADIAAKARGKLPVVAPLALEAVRRIDAIFDIERQINGLPAAERLDVRRVRVAPLVSDFDAWPHLNT
jgi:hypothetical protein